MFSMYFLLGMQIGLSQISKEKVAGKKIDVQIFAHHLDHRSLYIIDLTRYLFILPLQTTHFLVPLDRYGHATAASIRAFVLFHPLVVDAHRRFLFFWQLLQVHPSRAALEKVSMSLL